jgi:hypothetical protein
MMREFKGETFYGRFDRGDKLRIEEMRFTECTFKHCGLSLTQDISRMSEVRVVELLDCIINGCDTGPMIASDVTISNLRTSDLLILWCPYLDRVVLAGKIGSMKINPDADPSTVGNDRQKPFDAFRDRFYAGIEWALDISKARFRGFDIRGVPGRLIRRDPESQILVTRERALKVAAPGWEKQLDPSNKLWPFVINLFLSDGDPDRVLVAPLGAAKAKRDPLLKDCTSCGGSAWLSRTEPAGHCASKPPKSLDKGRRNRSASKQVLRTVMDKTFGRPTLNTFPYQREPNAADRHPRAGGEP